jgi:CheY-like chemotaxis protein
MRIALVEDNPADAHLFTKALRTSGVPVEVVWFHGGTDVVECLSNGSEPFDLMLLDLSLPVMTGFEVLEWLRANDEFRSLPVVVVSGSNDPADIDRCYRFHANSYICKPLHVDEIFDLARSVVNYWAACAISGSKTTPEGIPVLNP